MAGKYREVRLSHSSYDKLLEIYNKGELPKEVELVAGKCRIKIQLYCEVEKWLHEMIEFECICRGYGLSIKQIKAMERKIKKEHVLDTSWKSIVLQKKLIPKGELRNVQRMIEREKIRSGGKYITAGQAVAFYEIKETNLRRAVVAGRIQATENRFCRKELDEVIANDKKLVALTEKVKLFEREYSIKLGKTISKKIEEEVLKTNCFGCGLVRGEVYLGGTENKDNVYVNAELCMEEFILSIVRQNTKWLAVSNYSFMWQNVSDDVAEYLLRLFGVRAFAENKEEQPWLHQVMSVFIKQGKRLEDWLQSDIESFNELELSKNVRKKCFEIICSAKKDYGKRMQCYPKVVQIQGGKEKTKDNNSREAYSYEQFLQLGAVLFSEEILKEYGIIRHAIENEACAQVLFYMSMHYCCAWRRKDIVKFRAPYIDRLNEQISNLENGYFDRDYFTRVWLGIEKIWYIGMRASKNNGELILRTPPDFLPYMGMFLCIAEYHRLVLGNEKLLDKKKLDNIRSYLTLLGEDIYCAIFGRYVFRNCRMNKDLLVIYAREASKDYGMTIHTLPELVASYMRGHKFDFNDGQKTIFHYIAHMSDGMSVNEVSFELFRGGTMGHYKSIICRLINESFREKSFSEQVDEIIGLEIEPVNVELQLEAISDIDSVVSDIGLPRNYLELAERIKKAYRRNANNANEDNVFCLYEAVAGYRNPECIGRNNCLNCSKSKCGEALCDYGLYAWQYVYNLSFRIGRFIQMNEWLVEELNKYETFEEKYHEITNTLEKNYKIMNYLDDVRFDFISSSDVSDELRNGLLNLI